MTTSLTERSQIKNPAIDDVIYLFEAFLEREQHLFDRTVSGFHYWHYIRFSFIIEFFNAKKWLERVGIREQASLGEKISIVFGLLKNSILYGVERDFLRSELLVLNSPNKILEDGRYVDPYTETWLNQLSFPYTFWEAPLVWRHKKHGDTPSLFYLDSFLLRAQIHRYFLRKGTSLIRTEVNVLREFAKQFGIELSRQKIFPMLTYVVSLYHSCPNLIEEQLKLKQPKLLLTVNHYDPLKMLITAIAKSLGIYVVELQHGTMGKYHVAYNFRYSGKLDGLPNEIFTFGRFWNETTRISQNGVKLTAVGMPYFEERVKQKDKSPASDKTTILILSQDTIGLRLAEIAIELSKKLAPAKYQIWFKMHPREYEHWQRRYPTELQTSGIKVYTKADLYELLRAANIHIGVYSTAIIESLAFMKKLILIESYGVHFFSGLIEKGRAVLARNVEDVLGAIKSRQEIGSNIGDVSYYWEPDSRKKIINRILEILDK